MAEGQKANRLTPYYIPPGWHAAIAGSACLPRLRACIMSLR